jgi:hypothetical protein
MNVADKIRAAGKVIVGPLHEMVILLVAFWAIAKLLDHPHPARVSLYVAGAIVIMFWTGMALVLFVARAIDEYPRDKR